MNLTDPNSPGAQISIYIVVTFALTLALQFFFFSHVGINSLWSILLMWVPGLVGLACSQTFGYQYKDLGLHMPQPKYFIWAYLVPAGSVFLIWLVSVSIGLGESRFFWDKSTMNRAVFAPTLGVLVAAVSAVGQELGWRGFLHEQVKDAGIKYPYFFTGIAWALWHWPLILFSDYKSSAQSGVNLVLFTIMLVSFSIFLGQLREVARSIWPVAIAHAVHTVWILEIYPHFYTAGALDPHFGGESGVLLAIVYLTIAIVLQRNPLR